MQYLKEKFKSVLKRDYLISIAYNFGLFISDIIFLTTSTMILASFWRKSHIFQGCVSSWDALKNLIFVFYFALKIVKESWSPVDQSRVSIIGGKSSSFQDIVRCFGSWTEVSWVLSWIENPKWFSCCFLSTTQTSWESFRYTFPDSYFLLKII